MAEQEVTDWQALDVPIATLVAWGGPAGSIEFDLDNNRCRGVRPVSMRARIKDINGWVD